jgi:RND family efflux transporter MFP subunit
LPLLAAIGFGFALVSVLGRSPAPAQEPYVTPPSSPFVNTVAGIGVVEPKSEVVSIGSDLAGIVRAVPVKVGDIVKKGDKLFSLDTRDIDAQIAILEASLAAAKVQAAEAVAQYAIVQNIADSRAVSQNDVNTRKYAAQLGAARVTETAAQLQQARTTKERLTIKAPMDGEILSINVRAGESVATNASSEPLMRMGDTSTLHVRVEIDEENASRVQPHAKATGSKRGNPTHTIPLQFVRFEPFVRLKQNLAVSGQRVDTRVLQVIYMLKDAKERPFIGEQLDVFIAIEATSQ